MPDLLVLYGAVAGSAGLLSLAWQIVKLRSDRQTRVVFNIYHVARDVFPDDPRYEPPSQETRERLRDFADRMPNIAADPGVGVQVTNLSLHPIHLTGGGITQDATSGICATFWRDPIDVKPQTTYREFWIPDWWSVGEEGMDLHAHPIQAYVELDNGTTYESPEVNLFPDPPKRVTGKKSKLD